MTAGELFRRAAEFLDGASLEAPADAPERPVEPLNL